MSDLLEMLDSNEDRRVRKTKRALRNSLFALLETKNINQITVTELTKQADVNRSTFYLYYSDVFDMLEKIQDEIYNVLNDSVINCVSGFFEAEDFVSYCIRILELCKENYELSRFVARNGFNNQLADRIKIAVRNVVPDSAKKFDPRDPRHYMTSFALSGMTATILEWMNDGMIVPCEDMAKFLSYTYVYGSKMQKESDFYQNYSFYSQRH
ncbi:MAG: TetR/AcrR family transcriptional regulator C-terminal domain-containing protein [Acutalibacteraceae bacterium]